MKLSLQKSEKIKKMTKRIILLLLTIFSIFLLLGNTPAPYEDNNGILYFRKLDSGEWIIISGFGMRNKSDVDVRDTLLSMYERNDTITRMMSMNTSNAIIHGCYEYIKNPNQIFLSFCANEYRFKNGEYLKLEISPYCECK